LQYPQLYHLGQRNGLFNTHTFVKWLLHGFYHSAVVYMIPCYSLAYSVYTNGHSVASIWVLGSTVLGTVVIVINCVISLQVRFWIWIHAVLIMMSIGSWWAFLALCNPAAGHFHFGPANVGEFGMLSDMYGSSLIWLTTVLGVAVALIPTVIDRYLDDSKQGSFGTASEIRMQRDRTKSVSRARNSSLVNLTSDMQMTSDSE